MTVLPLKSASEMSSPAVFTSVNAGAVLPGGAALALDTTSAAAVSTAAALAPSTTGILSRFRKAILHLPWSRFVRTPRQALVRWNRPPAGPPVRSRRATAARRTSAALRPRPDRQDRTECRQRHASQAR